MNTEFKIERLFDLVRHQRAELHEADLISDEEYAALATATGSVDRLHKYDDMRERIIALERNAIEQTATILRIRQEAQTLFDANQAANAHIGAIADECKKFKERADALERNAIELNAAVQKWQDAYRAACEELIKKADRIRLLEATLQAPL